MEQKRWQELCSGIILVALLVTSFLFFRLLCSYRVPQAHACAGEGEQARFQLLLHRHGLNR